MPRFCGKCGRQAGDNEKFCAGCGASLPEAAQIPSPVSEADAATGSAPSQQNFSGQPGGNGEFNYFQQSAQNSAPAGGSTVPSGMPVDAAQPIGTAAAAKKINPVPIVIGAAALVVIIIAVIVVTRLTRFEKIDAKELIDVDFVGPDGYGQCYAQLDVDPYFASSEYEVDYEDYSITKGGENYDKVKYSDYFAEKKSKLEDVYKKAKDGSDAKDMRDALLDVNKKKDTFSITATPSKKSGLKNGDKVTIEVKFDEEDLKDADIKLTNTKFEVEVKGLTKAEELDPFKDFAPNFTGVDGDGECDYYYDDPDHDFLYYSIDTGSTYNLSNGDELIFSCTLSLYGYDSVPLDEKDSSKGMWFTYDKKVYIWPFESETATKTFTVEGLTPLEEIDPTEEIVLEYEGASPYLNVEAKLKDGSKLDGSIYINVENAYEHCYKAGENVKLLISDYSSLAESGYKLKGTPNSDGYYEYEMPIPADAPAYVDASTAYDAETTMKDGLSNQEKKMKQDLQKSSYYKGLSFDSKVKKSTITKVKSYICENEITDDYYSVLYDGINYIAVLYKVDCQLEKGKTTFYAIVSLSNVIKNSDGTYSSENDFSIDVFEKKEDAESEIKDLEGYTVSEISKDAAAPAPDETTSSATDSSSVAADSSSADVDSSSTAVDSSSTAAESSTAADSSSKAS